MNFRTSNQHGWKWKGDIMAENYSYPDTHEMFELYDVLEALLSKKNANIGLFEGAEVSTDPSLDFLIRILFTPVEDRCSYLSMLGGKVNKECGHTLEDIKAGTLKLGLIRAFLRISLKRSEKSGSKISERQNSQCFVF